MAAGDFAARRVVDLAQVVQQQRAGGGDQAMAVVVEPPFQTRHFAATAKKG